MRTDAHLFDLCRVYIDAKSALAPKQHTHLCGPPQQVALTISRETGAGAVTIAQCVAKRLQETASEKWAVFDRNLVQRVIEDHEMPARMRRFLPEDLRSGIASAVEEFFGLHPSAWTLVEKTTETILSLAKMGNAIIVGRGGAIIAGGLSNVVHVRLIGPKDLRIKHCMEFYQMDRAAAEKFVHEHDAARARYVRRYFHARIDDPLHYHITINTGRVGFETATELIVECLEERQRKLEETEVRSRSVLRVH